MDCGCPGDEVPLTECDIPSLDRARDAMCPSTPAPSSNPTDSPTQSPAPSTLAPTPVIMPVYCQNDGTIDVEVRSSRRTVCENKYHGPLHFFWETVGTSSSGLSDDEYFILVKQDGEEIYNSGQLFDQSSNSSSPLLTTEENNGPFVVEFDCDLENPFASCEGKCFC